MNGKAHMIDTLATCYALPGIQAYHEAEDEIRFRAPAPMLDPDFARFRNQAPVLNALAVSHRLSLLASRSTLGLPEDCAFAIRGIEAGICDEGGKAGAGVGPASGPASGPACSVALRLAVTARRYGAVTGLKTVLHLDQTGAAWRVTTAFDVLSAALAGFIRRERRFLDFADTAIAGGAARLAQVSQGHFHYIPAESDRISDGRRVDHVPALTIIDIAMLVAGKEGEVPRAALSAEFLRYADPRSPFDIVSNDGEVVFAQDGEDVARIRRCDSGARDSQRRAGEPGCRDCNPTDGALPA